MTDKIFSPMELDAIGEVMNISLGSSATAVSNLLDHRVEITTPTVSVCNVDEFVLGDLEPAVGVEIRYVSGLEGSNIMLLKRSDVKAIVDILMGYETPEEEFELNELTISAVCEVMNQMMGAASTALSDFLGFPVNISTPESFELDDFDGFKKEHFPMQDGICVAVRFQLKIEGVIESKFINVMSTKLTRELLHCLGVDGGDPYDTDRFLDIKLSCREQMLQKLMDYDPAKGAEYATYIFPFIRDALLRFRMGEEKWSVSSLTNYKMVRSMAWLYHNTKDAISEFAKKYNCDLALAEEYLKVVRGIRNQQPFYVTDEDGEETGEDVALDDTWNYADILWNGIQAEKVQRAFEKLNYREQTLLEKRLAICMTCGRVGSWKKRPTFEELAVMFEGSTASGAERAYRKAVDKLTELLVAEDALHAVRLKQKSKTKRKKKIAAAIYEYQADCDGEWGEISFDFENGTAEIVRLADWDTIKTNRFANKAIAYLLNCENEKPPKETMVAFNL